MFCGGGTRHNHTQYYDKILQEYYIYIYIYIYTTKLRGVIGYAVIEVLYRGGPRGDYNMLISLLTFFNFVPSQTVLKKINVLP